MSIRHYSPDVTVREVGGTEHEEEGGCVLVGAAQDESEARDLQVVGRGRLLSLTSWSGLQEVDWLVYSRSPLYVIDGSKLVMTTMH